MFEFLGRLFEILVFFAMIRSALGLIMRIFRGTGTARGGGPATQADQVNSGSAAQGSNSGASESTLLHQDPVCGTYVPAGSSLRKISKGQVFHFCSEACRDKFAG
jgi:YHS domain-containing protein